MALDKSVLIEGYFEEMKEHLASIGDAAISYKSNLNDDTLLALILRELHTIKGTSRMMGFTVIEQLSHGLEDVFKAIRDKQIEYTNRTVQLVYLVSARIEKCMQHITSDGTDKENVDDVMKYLDKDNTDLIQSDIDSVNVCLDTAESDNILVTTGNDLTSEANEQQKESTEQKTQKKSSKTQANNASNVAVAETLENDGNISGIKSIRINLDKISGIISNFDNLIIRQFKLKHQLDDLDYLEKSGETDVMKVMQRIHGIRKQFADDLQQLETGVFDVQSKIFDLQMMPLDIVLEPLRRSITLEAVNSGKNVEFDISSCDIALDKVILEQLSDVLIHLVRNALDHGIELPEKRRASGKSETGHISITTQSTSNRLEISVSDDGGGIDYESVRRKAISLFPEQEKEITTMDENSLSEYLFVSGFSTKAQTTKLSGRGVGLDIVRANMERIKGRIHLESKLGKGTKFILSVPLSLATLQGLFITAQDIKLLIPSHYVQEVIHVELNSLIQLQNQVCIHVRKDVIPVYELSSIIQFDNSNSLKLSDENEKRTIVIVEYLGRRMGIIIDSLLRYVSLVVKPLPPSFQEAHAFQGVVFDENYSIVPILHIPEIMKRLRGLRTYDRQKNDAVKQKRQYTILVADDSYTTRQIEKTILEAENYLVETAVDGIEALEVLKTKKIDAVITDIKMPRMDGLVLVNNIRRMGEYKTLPVFVVSSIYDEQTRRQFSELGIQGYIVKSDFERGNLISIVREKLNAST